MIAQLDQHTTIRELVGRYPQARTVFENFGIDYCCGGGRSLFDAATASKQDYESLLHALSEAAEEASPESQEVMTKNWYEAPLVELVDHIISTHHAYVKATLPRLRQLIPTVLNAHKDHHGNVLQQVAANFASLDNELSHHLAKEERVLFPYIVALEKHVHEGGTCPQSFFGSIQNPVSQMEHEHESAGQALAAIRRVTNDYELPGDACPNFEVMYEELKRFEADLHEHIHLENNILFPRAIELEQA